LIEFLNHKNSFLIDDYDKFEYIAKDIILNNMTGLILLFQ